MNGALPGPDGRLRCAWALGSEDYLAYHDTEWGRPVRGEAQLYERLCLESFQAGLSWLTILRKREAFRAAFAGFDPRAVAAYTEEDVQRLMSNAAIVRNRAKIEAAIANAGALLALPPEESLGVLLEAHRPPARDGAPEADEIPASTPQSHALAKALRARGFRFVGPTTAYAMLQATGYVNDHVAGCWVRDEL